jgi:hypothetical protein
VLPTWNPYAEGGTVLLAHPHSPVLSSWYAIVLLFGAPIGGIMFMMSAHFALHIAEGHLEWCVLGLMPWVACICCV